MGAKILVGTSGWQYDSWKGLFYPASVPKNAWLPYFSERFSTVEVNNSFYMLPSIESFRRWRRDSTPNFIVTVKANRFITHLKRLKDPAEPVALFWSRARELGDKLGPVLFQLPPRFPVDAGRLRALLDVLPPEMRAAFEFRDRSWETDEVLAMLDDRGAAFVLPDRPAARVRVEVTGGWSYVRFHQGAPNSPFYDRRKLARWAERIASLPAREVYVYFNNDPEGAAIRDAYTLIAMLDAAGCDLHRPDIARAG